MNYGVGLGVRDGSAVRVGIRVAVGSFVRDGVTVAVGGLVRVGDGVKVGDLVKVVLGVAVTAVPAITALLVGVNLAFAETSIVKSFVIIQLSLKSVATRPVI